MSPFGKVRAARVNGCSPAAGSAAEAQMWDTTIRKLRTRGMGDLVVGTSAATE
jgi:hypothetical protein